MHQSPGGNNDVLIVTMDRDDGLEPTRVETTNWYAIEVISWIHAITICLALSAYAIPGARFANFLWIVHVLDILCPICLMSVRLRGQSMADLCQVYTFVLSVMKICTVIIEAVTVARHLKTLCCGESFIHIVVLLLAGTFSTLLSLIEFLISYAILHKSHRN